MEEKDKRALPEEEVVTEGPGDELDEAAKEQQAALDKLMSDLSDTKNTLLRTAAEYDNYRKRTSKEKDASFGNGVAFAVNVLLPTIDALELAEQSPCSDEAYKQGVCLTLTKWQEALKTLGVEPLYPLDEAFNADTSDAVLHLEKEGSESGTVTQVLQKGYRLGDRVIRHAKVAVAP